MVSDRRRVRRSHASVALTMLSIAFLASPIALCASFAFAGATAKAARSDNVAIADSGAPISIAPNTGATVVAERAGSAKLDGAISGVSD